MRLPGKRPVGALSVEQVSALPDFAQDYIAALETKFGELAVRLESHLKWYDLLLKFSYHRYECRCFICRNLTDDERYTLHRINRAR